MLKAYSSHIICLICFLWDGFGLQQISLMRLKSQQKEGKQKSSIETFNIQIITGMKASSIYEQLKALKHQEQAELISVLRQHGEQVDGGNENHFEGDCPIIAGYLYETPADIVIMAVRVDGNGHLTMIGEDKECRGDQLNILPDDIFAGQLDYVTSEIGVGK